MPRPRRLGDLVVQVDGDGNETADKLAWSSVIVLLGGLIATTGLLLARRPCSPLLAGGAGALAALAAALSVVGIWTENDDDAFIKLLAVLWILTLLAYFLVPVLQRFTSAGTAPEEVRVLASEGDVELVATRAPDGRAIDAPPRAGRASCASAPLRKPAAVASRPGSREPRVRDLGVVRLLLDADAVAKRSLVHRVPAPGLVIAVLTRADGENDARSLACPDDHVVHLGGAMDKSHWRSGRSSPSAISSASPARTRKSS